MVRLFCALHPLLHAQGSRGVTLAGCRLGHGGSPLSHDCVSPSCLPQTILPFIGLATASLGSVLQTDPFKARVGGLFLIDVKFPSPKIPNFNHLKVCSFDGF